MKGMSEFGRAIYILSLLKDKVGITIEHIEEEKMYIVYRNFDFDVDYKAKIIQPAVGTQYTAIYAIAELLTIMYNELYTNNE